MWDAVGFLVFVEVVFVDCGPFTGRLCQIGYFAFVVDCRGGRILVG